MKNKLSIVKDYVLIFFGALVAAFAIEEFLAPCTIMDGGVIGVGMMVNNLTGIPLGVLTIAFNIPFLIIGSRKMGAKFIFRSGFAMAVFSVGAGVFAPWVSATYENLLAVCFGGVILGFGVGMVIRFGGCLDGTETVAILLNRKYGLPIGQCVLMINVVIYAVAGILFGLDRAMYSLLTYFITSKIIDAAENGFNQVKAAMIITDAAEETMNAIYTNMGRTCTIIEGSGLISGKKMILYCVINRFEIYELKRIINSVDASSFVTLSDVSEIIGNHIKSVPKNGEIKTKKEETNA